MSNIFKTNSRFSSLIDNIPIPPKKSEKIKEEKKTEKEGAENFNSFKSEKKRDNFRQFDDKDRERYWQEREREIKEKKELEEREKERKKQELLKIDNFPELSKIKKNDTFEQKNLNYIDKFKNEDNDKDKIEDSLDPDLVKNKDHFKPGWLLIKKDLMNGKIIMKNHPDDKNNLFKKNTEKTDNEVANDIINDIVKLHEKRTQEYIELNGYDTWEKMFKFTNWQEEDYDSDEDEDEDEDDVDDDENFDTYENDEYYN